MALLKFMAVGLVIGIPLAASAETATRSDIAYCRALSETYVRYIGHDEDYGRQSIRRSPLDGQVAVAQCKQGNAAAAIPVLERELRAQKFTLPARG